VATSDYAPAVPSMIAAARINGGAVRAEVEPRLLLSDFLRDRLRLTGTHVGCEQGVCGACTILLNGAPARACLMFACQLDGDEVWTIEGLDAGGDLAALQRAFRQHHALQCGFCTPGMLVLALDLLRRCPQPSEAQIREAMSAALCRCTGYWNILAAVAAAAEALAPSAAQPAA